MERKTGTQLSLQFLRVFCSPSWKLNVETAHDDAFVRAAGAREVI